MLFKSNLIDINKAIGNTIFIDTSEGCILTPLPKPIHFLREVQFGAAFRFNYPNAVAGLDEKIGDVIG